MLVTPTYVFAATHNTRNDAAAGEASGSGYEPKSVGAASRTAVQNTGFAALEISDGTVSWDALSAGTSLAAILYFGNGASITDTANELLCYIDTGTNLPINTNGGDVTLNFDGTNGAIKFD
jgi:hypothetical protein